MVAMVTVAMVAMCATQVTSTVARVRLIATLARRWNYNIRVNSRKRSSVTGA